MRIGLVSYEYAGGVHGGGIGTYMRHTANMLAVRGHEIVVFTNSEIGSSDVQKNIFVELISGPRHVFSENALTRFLRNHEANPFDLVEGAEYGADIESIINALPSLARVVKLHTASYQISIFNEAYLTLGAKARFIAGALRRGRVPHRFWGKYEGGRDPERRITLAADEVTSPSKALLDFTARMWPIDRERAVVIPHVFHCDPALLTLDPRRTTSQVTFIGRLEVRKGVLELARAIPSILDVVPSARFRFVGRSLPHPATGESLEHVMRRLAGAGAADRLEFTGAVPYSRMPEIFADSAIGVFPSYWEAYGFVCLEAMAAGCGVVGSSAGGMAEIIENGHTGLLIPPKNSRAIAEAIIELLLDPGRRAALGVAARDHVMRSYAPEIIGPLQEASYARAIARARARRKIDMKK